MSQTATIPASEYHKLKRSIERLATAAETADMINESEAARLMEMSKRHLQNKVCRGEMDGFYTIGAKGKRFYYKSRIVGILK